MKIQLKYSGHNNKNNDKTTKTVKSKFNPRTGHEDPEGE
jgi:hypothetical protein